MVPNRTLAVALGLAGWALTYVIAKSRTQVQRREHNLHKKQITTWEGEGGNLPPAASHLPHSGLH